jgi:ABC-type multidrug transport system ATPase subunit
MSSGERRRVSIGVDLIHDPSVLFLDEPASGLDSTSALQVMQILSQMAVTCHRTVLLTIHQPRCRLIETINKFLVLARGNVIYHGGISGMADHFSGLGHSMPAHVCVLPFSDSPACRMYNNDQHGRAANKHLSMPIDCIQSRSMHFIGCPLFKVDPGGLV